MASLCVLGDVTAACSLASRIHRSYCESSDFEQAKYNHLNEQIKLMRLQLDALSDLISDHCELGEQLSSLYDDMHPHSIQVEDPDNWDNWDNWDKWDIVNSCTSCSASHTGYVDRHAVPRSSHKQTDFASSHNFWNISENGPRVLDTDLLSYIDKMDGLKSNAKNARSMEARETQLWATLNSSSSLHDCRHRLCSNGRMKSMAKVHHQTACPDDDELLV
ncbi:hypothetical protein SCUCBS95973_002243 [Sporothrix curviconia]|uniref:Fungal N-terminal domain-containing protein n=1 Tax=Sporothrix curviconia TaxID=1260050 RepID=A0ABP0B5B2_9PEZI